MILHVVKRLLMSSLCHYSHVNKTTNHNPLRHSLIKLSILERSVDGGLMTYAAGPGQSRGKGRENNVTSSKETSTAL